METQKNLDLGTSTTFDANDKNNSLSVLKERTQRNLFSMTKAEAKSLGLCTDCKTQIRTTEYPDGPGSVYSSAGRREYNISGLCEHCFDKIFM